MMIGELGKFTRDHKRPLGALDGSDEQRGLKDVSCDTDIGANNSLALLCRRDNIGSLIWLAGCVCGRDWFTDGCFIPKPPTLHSNQSDARD